MNPLHQSWKDDLAEQAAAPAPRDLLAAARQRLAAQRHWRAVVRAGGDASASVNRAEYRADQARQCLAVLARAAQERRA